jgi:hypothetical protein
MNMVLDMGMGMGMGMVIPTTCKRYKKHVFKKNSSL